VTLCKQKQYVDGFVLVPAHGFSVVFPGAGGGGEGLVIRGPRATTFGFLPLLVEGEAKDWARGLFRMEVVRLTR